MDHVNEMLKAACQEHEYEFTFDEAQWLPRRKWEAYAMNGAREKMAKLKKVTDRKFLVFVNGGCITVSSLNEALQIISRLHTVLKY